MGDWVVDGWRGNKAGRPGQASSSSPGSAGVKRWQWQCCKLMVALRHQMDKQAGALRKLLLLACSCFCSCCPPPKHQLDERTDKFKAVATALRWRGLRGGPGIREGLEWEASGALVLVVAITTVGITL